MIPWDKLSLFAVEAQAITQDGEIAPAGSAKCLKEEKLVSEQPFESSTTSYVNGCA